MKHFGFLIVMGLLFFSCMKKKMENLAGDWIVVEYAKYANEEATDFQQGLSYWFMERYAQGIELKPDGTFFHRFTNDGIDWSVSEIDSKGTWELKKRDLFFTIDGAVIESKIIDCNKDNLWIKYEDDGFNFEYKLEKEN